MFIRIIGIYTEIIQYNMMALYNFQIFNCNIYVNSAQNYFYRKKWFKTTTTCCIIPNERIASTLSTVLLTGFFLYDPMHLNELRTMVKWEFSFDVISFWLILFIIAFRYICWEHKNTYWILDLHCILSTPLYWSFSVKNIYYSDKFLYNFLSLPLNRSIYFIQ